MHLKEFKNEFLDKILTFLWREWSLLGVGGYAESEDNWIIDPEALLIFSLTFARYDARLFDEIIDWLSLNSRFINIQRFYNIIGKYPFSSSGILSTVAEKMILLDSRKKNKWLQLSETYTNSNRQNLFFSRNGKPLPVNKEIDLEFNNHLYQRNTLILKENSKPFDAAKPIALILKLRAFLGLNARCEIIAYLSDGKKTHPSRISKDTYYYQKTVQDTLIDMTASGLVYCSTSGREKNYYLIPEKWGEIIKVGKTIPRWINWVPLFYSLELTWSKISFLEEKNINSILAASEIKELCKKIIPEIELSGFMLENKNLYHGMNLLDTFFEDLFKILQKLIA